MVAGKMVLAHERSQTGGYHYFRHPVARQLQRSLESSVETLAGVAAVRRRLGGECA